MDQLAGGLLVGAGIAAVHRLHAWRREERSIKRERDGRGARQRRDCEEVLRQFLRTRGYLTDAVATRAELKTLIGGGITPAALRRLLDERAEEVTGPMLGHQRLGERRIPVRLPLSARARHVYSIGRTGTGKTTYLRSQILQDMAFGNGLAVVAPEAETINDELLPFIPESRWDDVVIVDPADLGHPVPFNPLHMDQGEDLDRKSAELMAIFQRLCGEEGGMGAPRMETILRQALYALLPVEGTTLLDVERLLDRQDDCFRRWIIDQTSDEDTRHFWRDVYPVYPKDAHLSLLNRLGRFLRPRVIRNLLCQSGPSFNVRRAMDERRILLFKLSDGLLGEENAQLLGQLVVAKIQLAALSRANVPHQERPLFLLYVDEFQRFANSAATSYEVMLSRARKYALGLNLAHQQMGQIGENLMREILGNVGTVIAFQVGATDARRLSRELIGEVDGQLAPIDPQELVSLRIGEAICRIGRSVFRLHTLPPPEGGDPHVRDQVIRRSRARFGSLASQPERPDRGTPLQGLDPREAL